MMRVNLYHIDGSTREFAAPLINVMSEDRDYRITMLDGGKILSVVHVPHANTKRIEEYRS